MDTPAARLQRNEPELQLLRFGQGGRERLGLRAGDRVLDIVAAIGELDIDVPVLEHQLKAGWESLLTDWDRGLDELSSLKRRAASVGDLTAYPRLAEVDIRAPIAPPRLFFAAANYASHRAETAWLGSDAQADATPRRPYLFSRIRETVIGPTDAVIRPDGFGQLDYEVELGAVIGVGGKHIAADRALQHVAAFVLVNDVSLRDLQLRADWPDLATDWLAGKNFDSSCPLGPYLVPRRCIDDYGALRLTLAVNGEPRQDELAREMTFSLEEQIAFVSSFVTLRPGDLISTGTPSGVVLGMSPARWLQPGDVIEAASFELGAQRNEIRSESEPGADETSAASGGRIAQYWPDAHRSESERAG